MVWTKDEVDKYVVQVERNCKSAHERNLKGFAFARLYREASDNESAKRYLEAYISESEGDFRGHCLMGQLYESLGELEKAVASYRRSLELNNTQKELVLKVVRLYCSVPVHPDRARAWADRGARLFPGHPDVFQLRIHLLESAEVVDYEALEDLISEELSKRPRDANLHIRLVKLYSVQGRLDEAFSHCVAVWKTKAFKDSLEWVACCVEIFEKYLAFLDKAIKGEVIGSSNAVLDVHSFLLIALCHFLELQLAEGNTREVINVLYRTCLQKLATKLGIVFVVIDLSSHILEQFPGADFNVMCLLDHCVFMAHKHKIRQTPGRSSGPTEWDVILTEMKAQLYMHCGTLLIRLAKDEYVTWPRGLRLACACYLASVSISEPETKTPWVARAPKNKDPLKWFIMACSRLSQVGHFLVATRDRHGGSWIETCHLDCCSQQGLEEILSTVYRDERDLAKSFLAVSDELSISPGLFIPDNEQLVSWDEVAVTENPHSLQNIIWVGLHWYQFNKEMRPGVGVMVKDIFPELRLDVPNIEKQIAPNMLCLRDIEAFVYAVVRTTSARVLEDKDILYEDYEPQLLPQPLCSPLSLPVQNEWWLAAYNLYTGKFSLKESGKIRRTVQLGIEKIRAVDERHGLHVQLLIYLGKSFGSKASFLKSSGENPWYYEEHWKSLEKWGMHYLRKALAILEKFEKDESMPYCDKPLFPDVFDTLQEHDVRAELQSVRLAIGGALMKEGKLFDAMEMFEQVKTPPAMYNLAQVYKYLAHVEACAATEETDTESACPTKEYYQNLHEARDLLQSYLKMTKSSDVGRKAVLDELSEIDRLIKSGFPRPNAGQHRDTHQRTYLESRSSTNASDAQESDDNFWPPPDPNTKDFIATLSEVALNKGYFQEQMAIRDEAMSIRDETISSMQEEISMLKKQIGLLQSSHYGYSSIAEPSYSSPGDQSKPIYESTPVATRQTPLSLSTKPLTHPSIKRPLKIDSNFFAGLGSSNSPENRVKEPPEEVPSPTSPGRIRHDSSASYTEDIHFEPLIPLPEQIEVQTGEEDETTIFSSRAKLYRYDKDVSAWKERGIGTMKILHNSEKGRSRILMRREGVHKVCANHVITADMKLEEKKATANCWIWSTLADFSEEVARAEQLAVKFKTPDEFLLFKEKFEECQELPKKDAKGQGITAGTYNPTADLAAKFAPKPGSWSCSVCWVPNDVSTTVCLACGAPKLPGGSGTSTHQSPLKSGFHLPKESIASSSPQTSMLSSCHENSSSGSPFVFKQKDAGSLSSSPFTFVFSTASSFSTSTAASKSFSFGAPLAADSKKTAAQLDTLTATQVSEVSSGSPFTTYPSSTQPFVLSSFGVPAMDKSRPSPFNFGTVSSTESAPFSFSETQKAVDTTPVGSSVFGGGSPEQGGPAISFGSFGTGNSPIFDLDAPREGEGHVTPIVSTQTQLVPSQSQSSFPFSVSTGNSEIPEQKLFWQQPTRPFQFGQLETIPPLGGSTSWAQADQPLFKPPASQLGALIPNVEFPNSELLRLLAAAKEEQDSLEQEAQPKGYDFTPYLTSSRIVAKDYDDEGDDDSKEDDDSEEDDKHDAKQDDEDSTADSLSYTSTDPEYNDEDIETSMATAPKPSSSTTSQAQIITTPAKPVQILSSQVEKSTAAYVSTHVTGRRILTAKSPLKGSKKQDDDCILVYEVRSQMADREKAHRLFLPPNFFNYTKRESCPGCIGCRGTPKRAANTIKQVVKDIKQVSTSATSAVLTSTAASHVFGQSANFGQLTFSSFKAQGEIAFSQSQTKTSHKPFQGAGQQLFAEPAEEVEEQDSDKLHFEPVIPLPEEIQVVTGEEGLEVMFSERAKLYRFDGDSSQWKERGIGEVKLLRHPTSGRGRVLMRREQIKKLCANHNITAEMELKPNVGSDRSWVWYTSADYSEGEGKPEKLAIKFKTAETAGKFKQVFDELKEPLSSGHPPGKAPAEHQKATGCELYKQFLSNFAPAPGTWSCEVCYVENKAEDSACVACNSLQPNDGETEPPSKHGEETATANVSVVDSVEPKTFQNLNKEASTSFFFQPPGGKGLHTSKLFTIGRGESSVDKDTRDDEIDLSPSKTSSPSKKGIITPQPSTQDSQDTLVTGLPFGTGAPCDFTFKMTVSPGSPPQKPRSPLSHTSPTSPVRGDDDGPYFEPLIPLPDKVECRTGEEGQEVLFCERCKLFRYDSGTSQWKERGVGDIKILLNPSSKRYRILMRREHVFKLCANHVITSEMQLKPFPNSARAWLWTTLADFSEETTTAQTVAARFKSNDVANQFKEVFDKALQTLSCKSDSVASFSNAEENPDQATEQKAEEDIAVVFEKIVTEDQKARAQKLELPCNFFGYERETSVETISNQAEVSASAEGQTTEIPDVTTSAPSIPSQSGFLFGSASVASLSFQSVAASSLTASPFGKKTPDKSGLKGAGSQLFATPKTEDDSEGVEADGNHTDGPHFEPIIPLPDRIDVKTGEEDEEVMFSHRAKLYRFVAEEKQWKERGIGDIKLLRNARSGKMRVLMRRDQVLKLCANHQITTDMNLQPNAGSDRSWVWSTHADFSEGECKAEQLAVRFKNEDIARKFKEKFDECQEMLKNQASLKPPLQKETVNTEDVKEDLLAKFKGEEGSWECDTCMVRNGSDKLICAACTSPKPGIKDNQEKKSEGKPIFGSETTSSGTGFTFGSDASSSGTGFSFGSGATPYGKGFVFGSTGTNEGGAKPFFSFGSSNLTPSSSSETATTFGSMTQLETTIQEQASGDYIDVSQTDQQTPDVDNKQPGNGEKNNVLTADTGAGEGEKVETTSFGESEAPQKNKSEESSEEKAFLFGSPSISAVSFQSVAASSIEDSPFGQNAKTKSRGFAGAGSTLFASQSPGGETHEEEEQGGDHDGPHFEPIIALPEKIDVKTGEEDEEVMFSHRSKLYRFVAEEKQWKERGIGDIKLLRNVTSGKMRVLMRRDQVLKLCANHQITTEMSLQPNAGSDRSWVWSTHADFSEGECKAERLAVRFKNEDIAKQFKEKFEECQEMLKNQASLKPPLQKETVNTEGVKEDLFAKFKAEEGSWECDTCMVRNGSDKLVCAACTTPKSGAQTSQMLANGGTPSFSFGTAGAPSNSGFSFGSPAFSVDAGSGFASASIQGFSFGSDSSSPGTGFVFGQQKADEKSSKPVFSFGLGSTGPFSFGSTQKEENTGVRVDDVGEGGNYSDDQASSDEGSNCGDDFSQTSEEDEVTVGGEGGEKRQEGLGTGLLEGWKPEEGSWECNTCLVRNKSEKLECVACASPKPGVDGSLEKKTEGKPLFGFGSGSSFSSAGFSFGTSTSSSGAGFSFGSGSTSTGAEFSLGFNGQSDGGESQKQRAPSSSNIPNVTFGSTNQSPQSSNTETAVDSEEKPLSPLKPDETSLQSDGFFTATDAVEKQETTDESSKPGEILEEVNSERKAALSTEDQASEDVQGDGESDKDKSLVEEKRGTNTQPEVGANSPAEDVQFDCGADNSESVVEAEGAVESSAKPHESVNVGVDKEMEKD